MGSSLRNSIHRRNHKERGQLAHRTKLGLLEKHSDYVKRARDYHSKQARLTRLKQKAEEKNKDEFYFSMARERTQGGVHIKDRGNVALPTDFVKLLKTQDENYVRTIRAAGRKRIDQLKNHLMTMADLLKPLDSDTAQALDPEELQVLTEAGIIPSPKSLGKRKANHIIFVENQEAAKSYNPPQSMQGLASDLQTAENTPTPVDLGWLDPSASRRSKRKNKHAEAVMIDGAEDEVTAESSSEHRVTLLKELSARLVRDRQLRYAQREFEMQRALMGKGATKKIAAPEKVGAEEDDEDAIDARKGKQIVQKVDPNTYKPRVYKWRKERKR